MKKVVSCILILVVCILEVRAQVPYYGATVGKEHLFGYHSLKVRPGIRRIIGLTGTPASNGLMDLWAEFKLLDG